MRVLLMLALVACGSSAAPTDKVDCENPLDWGTEEAPVRQCDRGCAAGPASADEIAGADQTQVEACRAMGCNDLALFDGEIGCCAPELVMAGEFRYRWLDCE